MGCPLAGLLDQRGVTISADHYREIFISVFMDAAAFRQQTKINYFPAYLRQVIQSHFSNHGDEYYDEAKSLRTITQNALQIAARLTTQAAPDPVRELARASALLRPKKKAPKRPLKAQLTLL